MTLKIPHLQQEALVVISSSRGFIDDLELNGTEFILIVVATASNDSVELVDGDFESHLVQKLFR